MKRYGKLALTVVLIFILSSFCFAQSLEKDGRYWTATIEEEFKVSSSGLLEIEDVEGDISVEVWNKNVVRIVEIRRMDIHSKDEAEHAVQDAASDYVQTGNTIRIDGSRFQRRWIQSDFKIAVPRDFNCDIETEGGDVQISGVMGTVDVRTGGGDIEIENIGGPTNLVTGGGDVSVEAAKKSVDVKTGGGDVDLSNISDYIEVITGGGDIGLENVHGTSQITTGGGDIDASNCDGEMEIKTGGGDIDISSLNASLEIQTGGGDIDLNGINGSCQVMTGGGDVDAETVVGSVKVKTGGGEISLYDIQGALDIVTGGGDVYAQITLRDFKKDHHVSIETGAGEIVLELPAKLPATIQALVELKHHYWEDHDISSDFPLSITTESHNGGKVIRAEGDINGGGDSVRLFTRSGDIYIKKTMR